jgi:hypothetical protein
LNFTSPATGTTSAHSPCLSALRPGLQVTYHFLQCIFQHVHLTKGGGGSAAGVAPGMGPGLNQGGFGGAGGMAMGGAAEPIIGAVSC